MTTGFSRALTAKTVVFSVCFMSFQYSSEDKTPIMYSLFFISSRQLASNYVLIEVNIVS